MYILSLIIPASLFDDLIDNTHINHWKTIGINIKRLNDFSLLLTCRYCQERKIPNGNLKKMEIYYENNRNFSGNLAQFFKHYNPGIFNSFTMQKPKRLYVSHVLKFEKIYEKFCCRNFVIFSFHWKYSAKKWCKNISGRSINYSMFQYQTFTSDRNKTLSWSNNEGKTQCTKSMYHHQKSKKK